MNKFQDLPENRILVIETLLAGELTGEDRYRLLKELRALRGDKSFSASSSKPERRNIFERFRAQLKNCKSDDWLTDFWRRFDAAETAEEVIAITKELQAFARKDHLCTKF